MINVNGFSHDALEAMRIEKSQPLTITYSKDDNGVEKFKEELSTNTYCPALTLRLESKEVPFEVCLNVGRRISQALMHNSYLTILDMSNNKIGYEVVSELANSLRTNSSLTVLDLSNNDIDDRCAYSLSDSLMHNMSLTTLHLDNNDINDIGASSFVEVLENHNDVLTVLTMKRNQGISDEVLDRIAKATKHGRSPLGAAGIGASASSYLALARLNCLWK